MSASLDSRDYRHADVGDVFHNLNAFVVDLAPDAGICDIAEGWEIDVGNEVAACSGQDYDLVRSVLRDPVKGIDKLRVVLRSENKRPAARMKFDSQHTVSISRHLEAAIGSEVVGLKHLHILLSD
jgi:hypothetical protein